MSLLEIDELVSGYGPLPVLREVSLRLEAGRTCVLLGLNGAGKTTLVHTIVGLNPVWSGRVRFDGVDITGLTPPEVLAAGIALCPEGRRVWPATSVGETLVLGGWGVRDRRVVAERRERVLELFPRLAERINQNAGTLSGGEQQMLAIGRALMSGPRLLCIDEASLGLSPKLAASVFAIVAELAAEGTAVLLVEQNAGALERADTAVIMEKGRITHRGAARELAEAGTLRESYLGERLPG